MKKIFKIGLMISAVSGVCISTSVSAQDFPKEREKHLYKLREESSSAKTYNISLQEAVDYAQENNKNLQQIKNNTLKALYGKVETIGNYLPKVTGTVEYSNSLKDINTDIGFTIPAASGTVGVQATQVIFNGNAVVGIILGKIGQMMAELNEENQASILKMSVAQAYYAVLLSEESRKILVRNIAFMRDLAEKTKSLADGGAL